MRVTRPIFEYPFSLVAAGTTNQEFSVADLSHAYGLTMILVLTAADTEAGDTLDVKIQDRWLDGLWNTRMRFKLATGDMSPTALTPETIRLVLQNGIALAQEEQAREPSGSLGASEPVVLGDGIVVNGPFPPVYRTAAGRGASWRAQLVATESGAANINFAGTLYGMVTSEW